MGLLRGGAQARLAAYRPGGQRFAPPAPVPVPPPAPQWALASGIRMVV